MSKFINRITAWLVDKWANTIQVRRDPKVPCLKCYLEDVDAALEQEFAAIDQAQEEREAH